MLQRFIGLILGPVTPPSKGVRQMRDGRPCNVVGGCGEGCLCVPDQRKASASTHQAERRSQAQGYIEAQFWEN